MDHYSKQARQMKPLKITAHLRSGFTAAFDWSVSIDGILAYQFMLEKLGVDAFTETHGITSEQEPVIGLPLAVEQFNNDWWYQCSRPFFRQYATHVTKMHRRFNAQEAELYVGDKTRIVQTTKGPHKNARLSIPKFITSEVTWYAVGDKEEIERLLGHITHIGGQRRSGFGAVGRWSVAEHDSIDDCRFKRALPIEFAEIHGIEGVPMQWPIRPPARHPHNLRRCIIPEGVTRG